MMHSHLGCIRPSRKGRSFQCAVSFKVDISKDDFPQIYFRDGLSTSNINFLESTESDKETRIQNRLGPGMRAMRASN